MYILTQLGFIVLTLLCLWAILRQLHQALSKADWSETKKQRLWIRTLIGLGAWLLFISVASLSGLFSDFSSFPPRVVIVITIPFITILLITFSRSINAILKVIPPQNLLYIQAFRVIVEVLLWMLFLQELLPEQMTFEGRNWDILVGLTAPLMAYFGLVRGKLVPVADYCLECAGANATGQYCHHCHSLHAHSVSGVYERAVQYDCGHFSFCVATRSAGTHSLFHTLLFVKAIIAISANCPGRKTCSGGCGKRVALFRC
ncbi:MAG: hypothetical protein AAF992_22100 [Bacteroidota bacterium]